MVTNNTGIDFDADVAYAVADLGDSMTWGGTAYACVISEIDKAHDLDGIAGPLNDIAFEIVVQTSLLSSEYPSPGQTVTVGGTVYRIVRVVPCPSGSALNIYAEAFTS